MLDRIFNELVRSCGNFFCITVAGAKTSVGTVCWTRNCASATIIFWIWCLPPVNGASFALLHKLSNPVMQSYPRVLFSYEDSLGQ